MVLLGGLEYLVWLAACWWTVWAANRFTIWLWFLTAEMQRKIDERDDMQGL